MFAMLVKSALQASDSDLHHAMTLADGLEALDSARGNEFDIVLLDLTLPDSDFTDTYLEFRRFAPDIPVIVLTAMDDEELALDLVRAGAQDYLIKAPLDRRMLNRAVSYAVERNRLQRQLKQQAHDMAVMESRNQVITVIQDEIVQTLFSASTITEIAIRLCQRDQKTAQENMVEASQLTRQALLSAQSLLLQLQKNNTLELLERGA